MRKLRLLGMLLSSLFLAVTCWAGTITSALGHHAPAFAPGMTPSKLGWGPDDNPYPNSYIVIPRDGSEMVWVPAGEFMMGSPEGEGASAEHPQHKIRITKGFWLGKCTVAITQYRAFCQVTGRAFPSDSTNGPKHPVEYVSWKDAKAYCDQYGLVLPTEAQWEYAARGPEGRKYPWGNDWDPKKCCNDATKGTGDPPTIEVGSLPAGDSWCGASDMAGNLWQWCADWYDSSYYGSSPHTDPTGPATGTERLLRGGSWHISPEGCRSAYRLGVDPDGCSCDFSFRVARTP